MMCCCRLARLPTVMAFSALSRHVCQLLHHLSAADCTVSLERITGLCSESNQNIKQRCRPVPHAEPAEGSGGKWFHKKHQRLFFFAVVPPVDRNLRSRQECMRAWSWLSSTQISVLQQVCSDRPHSCSCLQLFVLSAFNTWPVATHEYLCSNSLHMPHHITLVCSVSCTKLKIPSCVAPNSTSFALDPGNPFPPCEFLVCSQ